MDLRAHLRARVGGKEGKKEIKIDGMNRIGSGLVRVKGRRSCISRHLTTPNKSNITRETESWNIYKSSLET